MKMKQNTVTIHNNIISWKQIDSVLNLYNVLFLTICKPAADRNRRSLIVRSQPASGETLHHW